VRRGPAVCAACRTDGAASTRSRLCTLRYSSQLARILLSCEVGSDATISIHRVRSEIVPCVRSGCRQISAGCSEWTDAASGLGAMCHEVGGLTRASSRAQTPPHAMCGSLRMRRATEDRDGLPHSTRHTVVVLAVPAGLEPYLQRLRWGALRPISIGITLTCE
jgi:hypothetical protein